MSTKEERMDERAEAIENEKAEKVSHTDRKKARELKKINKLTSWVDKATTHLEHREKAVTDYKKHLEEKGATEESKQTWHQKHKLARLNRWVEKAKTHLQHRRDALENAREASL